MCSCVADTKNIFGGAVPNSGQFLARALAAVLFCMVAGEQAGALSMSEHSSRSSIVKAPFGQTSGAAVELYRLRNHHGMEARIATYGGIVTYLTAPDREGRYADVVLGYDSLAGYLKSSPYFGALIGRYGNRIA